MIILNSELEENFHNSIYSLFTWWLCDFNYRLYVSIFVFWFYHLAQVCSTLPSAFISSASFSIYDWVTNYIWALSAICSMYCHLSCFGCPSTLSCTLQTRRFELTFSLRIIFLTSLVIAEIRCRLIISAQSILFEERLRS